MFMRLRKFVRNKTGPIPVDVARTWKFNLSFVYAVLAWNILGLAGYYIINFNAPRNNGGMYLINTHYCRFIKIHYFVLSF